MATSIKRGRSYCYGVVQKDAEAHEPRFRFKESALPGDFLLDSGIETWEDFFLVNPLHERRRMTHTVYEIEVRDGRRTLKYITEGMFAPSGVYPHKTMVQTKEVLGDTSGSEVLYDAGATPMSAYSANPISLPEVNEILQNTFATQAEFVNEQMGIWRSILTEKDNFIHLLQQNEQQKIADATALYNTRIESLETQVKSLMAEKAILSAERAALQAQIDRLEWQAKESKKIEERLQRDFEEATKVFNRGLSDSGSKSLFDRVMEKPFDEVVRGFFMLKDMFFGNGNQMSPSGSLPYTQEQLQQLYEQIMRYAAQQTPPSGGATPSGGVPSPVGANGSGSTVAMPPTAAAPATAHVQMI